ncbi:MAG: hypothetical protein ACLTMP_10715 [Eggerthella lenta]
MMLPVDDEQTFRDAYRDGRRHVQAQRPGQKGRRSSTACYAAGCHPLFQPDPDLDSTR